MFPFCAPEEIPRLRKGRDPARLGPSRISSDVVHVKMRTGDGIDRIDRKTRRFHVFDEAALEFVPHRIASNLVVSDTSIDHDSLTTRIDHERLDTDVEFFVVESKVILTSPT